MFQSYLCDNYNRIKLMKEEKEEKIDVVVQGRAYRKIVYHLLRYPSSKVMGLLVGQSSTRVVTNAYPLFHTPLVNPTFNVALDLVQSNLKQGQVIIGFYQFVEGSEMKLNSMLQNNQILKEMLPMKVWMNGDKQIQMTSIRYNFQKPSWDSLSEGLRKGEYRYIVDMDAHLQEIELDFRNNYLD